MRFSNAPLRLCRLSRGNCNRKKAVITAADFNLERLRGLVSENINCAYENGAPARVFVRVGGRDEGEFPIFAGAVGRPTRREAFVLRIPIDVPVVDVV